MRRSHHLVVSRSNHLLPAAALFAVASLLLASAICSRAESQNRSSAQSAPPATTAFEFDVASIKPTAPGSNGGVLGWVGDDTFRVRGFTLASIIQSVYGYWGLPKSMVSGGPAWIDVDRYDIMAKLDSSVADRLKKLTPDEREMAQNRMVQALLADRFKLTIHREAKELPVYNLIIAKGGLKLKEAKPGDTYENAFPYAKNFAGGDAPAGKIFLVGNMGPGGTPIESIYGFAVSTAAIARQLTFWARQTVQDKTGLTGDYDFVLKYALHPPTQNSSAAGPDGQAAPSLPDPAGVPDLFGAIQQQLGLKLESGKGPVEIVVIDHAEKPSAN
jgi:uncharacterized protein (TIGR03435 family)